MDSFKDKDAPKEYSFVAEERRSSGPGSLTLLRRSKRVLGDVDLGEASEPPEKDPLTPIPATSKRREQVRKAQRTHRQRTQAYIKELENEVLRLRTSEAEALSKVGKLQRNVNSLLEILADNSIATPDHIRRESPPVLNQDISIELNTLADPITAMINVKHSPMSTPHSYKVLDNETNLEPSSGSAIHGNIENTAEVSDIKVVQGHYIQPTILQDPQIGIDFVLALERPCLAHLRESHLDYNDLAAQPSEQARLISGHLFTASLQLWKPRPTERQGSEEYEISTADLQRLLDTSLNIGVKDDELTPVQIWNLLKQFTMPVGKEKETLEILTEELSRHTECIQLVLNKRYLTLTNREVVSEL